VGVEGPASFTADSMAVVRPRVSAPRMVFITDPERKMRNVGILEWSCQYVAGNGGKRRRKLTLERHIVAQSLADCQRLLW
jgi:hypothetical protein